METRPIFIAGADRSGTTLTYAILVSHPSFAIVHPSPDLWTFFYKQYGDLSKSKNFERCLEQLLKYKPVYNLKPDPKRIRKEFWEGSPTYARLFALFQEHFAEQVGKPRWGDKTSYIERYTDPIIDAYPQAKILHLIRDPRDRYASAITRWPDSKGRVGGATARWIYSVHLGQRNLKKYPDHYKIILYENLIAEPEKEVREICEFLGEQYDPLMLTLHGAEKFVERGGNSSYNSHKSKISTASIGRFRKVISQRDIAFIQKYAKNEMLALGYELDPIDLSINDRLSYFLSDWPMNLSLMAAWQAKESIQHNLPRQFGRKPHPKTILN